MMDASFSSLTQALELRPLRTSELLDRSFQLYRRHFIPLFLLASIIYAFNFVIGLCSEYLRGGRNYTYLVDHPNAVIALLLLGLCSMIILEIGAAILTVYTADLYLGRSRPLRACLQTLQGRVVTIAAASLLKCFLLSLSFVPSIVVFVLLALFWAKMSLIMLMLTFFIGLLLATPGLILLVRLLLTTQIIMLEHQGIIASFRRSAALARYHPNLGFWYWGATRLSLILLVFVVISGLIGLLSATPLIVAHLAGQAQGLSAPSAGIFSPAVILTRLFNYLGNAVVAPLYVIGPILFYYDVRVRKEGFDLQLLAATLRPLSPLLP